ncbi:MAG: mutA, partial [Caulobacteraceae bacterium]|nr:mutA [Caulobacteraceae bacterium]
MADASVLAHDFPPATPEAWRALVVKTLGEAPFASLEKATAEGLPIAPLYAPGELPGSQPFPPRPFDADRHWDVRALSAHPDPAAANRELLADLEGGAASVVVRIDPAGERGVAVGSAEGLARVLDGVILELAPVALDAGFLGPKAADWLGAVAKASPGAKL